MKKRIVSIMLLVALLALDVTMAGCSEAPQNGSGNETSTETATNGEQTTAEDVSEGDAVVEEEIHYTADVPEKDFGGSSFVILTAGNWDTAWTEIDDFSAEEITGEVINDAVFTRNEIVQNRFNVKIEEVNKMGNGIGGTGKGRKFLENSVTAGDNAYDASQMGAYDVSSLAYGSYILDLNSQVPYIDLTQPYWDQQANADLNILGRMYYTTGDISTLDNDCTFCLLFNKKLIEDYKLENPYDLVREGKWTIDKFNEMAYSVSGDVDGDGDMDEHDLYGYCIWQDSMMGVINAAGEKFATVNENGEIQLTLMSERSYDMFTKYYPIASDRNIAYSLYHQGDHIEDMFANNQVLFYSRYLCIIKKYREMETDFGVLPYFKYDEAQQNYYSTVAPYGCSFICVPIVVKDIEMTGIVLQSMACESMYTVTPAYYEISLEGKMMRDEDSYEMLDIILGHRVFDLGLFYQVGGYNEGIMNLHRNYNEDFVSFYEKSEKIATKSLKKINDAFAEMFN